MKEKKSYFNCLCDFFEVPRDISNGDIRFTVMGNTQMWIENYRGIVEYNPESIIIQNKNCRLHIQGKKLLIVYYSNEGMKISGLIKCINYL